MSSEYLFKATKAKTKTVYEKLILILLSDIADNKGSCYPSIAYLTEASCCSRNTVKKALNGLVDAGILVIEHRSVGGLNSSNLYHITLGVGQEVTNSVMRRPTVGQEVTEGGSGGDPNTLIDTPKDTPIKHICSNWQDWIDHRKQMKKPLTKKTIELQTKFLQKFDEQTKVKIIEQSIFKGWAGLFELKEDRYETSKSGYRLSALERVQQANRERAKKRAEQALQNGDWGDSEQVGVTLGADDGVVWEQVD
jgi:ribosomal protein L21E